MSLFRPARTVTTPSGEDWELYVSKTAPPAWRQGRAGNAESDPFGGFVPAELLLALPGVIWGAVVRPLLWAVVLFPAAWVKGRRSRAVQIRALSQYPARRVLLWTTTEGQADRILDEIATGLLGGKVVQPAGAVYSGEQTG
jgi:hypothetical protein